MLGLIRGRGQQPAKADRGCHVSVAVLIADDSAVMRHSLRSCVEQNPGWTVCGEAENGQVAVEKVKELNPNVVILDWQMPVMNGLEAARQITRIAPNTTMVMVTLYSCEQLVKEAQAVGIQHVLSKSARLADMIASLRTVYTGS